MKKEFENIKFGQPFLTRSGHDAIFMFKHDSPIKPTYNFLVNTMVDSTTMLEVVTDEDGFVCDNEHLFPTDIVSRKPIDEERMNKVLDEAEKVRESAVGRKETGGWYWRKWAEWGYKKALENER